MRGAINGPNPKRTLPSGRGNRCVRGFTIFGSKVLVVRGFFDAGASLRSLLPGLHFGLGLRVGILRTLLFFAVCTGVFLV